MKEFSIGEILEFSRNIEMESYRYYSDAKKLFSEAELIEVLQDLSEQEMEHYNRFNNMIESKKLSAEELDTRVSIAKADHDMLVNTRDLPENPSAMVILKTAYNRERSTEAIYRSLISLTNISEDIVELFTDLMHQEQGHANRISSLMKKYE